METELYPLPSVGEQCRIAVAGRSMTNHVHQLTIVQHPEVHPPENETSLVPNRVLRHLYTTVHRFQIVAPHLPLLPGLPPANSIAGQPCLLAEIAAATCSRKHDRLLNARAAARLAHGETFADLLKSAPAPAAAHDALPSGFRDRFSLDQFAATMAFISKLRGEDCVFFVLLGKQPLDESFRHVLRACGECCLPVLFYTEAHLDLSAGKRALRDGEDLDSVAAEFGVPVITTDVHDPVALYRVTTEAVHHSRFGRGATVIESIKIIAAARQASLATPSDPLEFMMRYMEARGIWDPEWAKEHHRAALEELEAALAAKGD